MRLKTDHSQMTIKQFAPKDAETLKAEITTELGITYEGNEELVDKMVARELKSEEFKASLHEDKVKHLKAKEFYKGNLTKAGFDPKTGEKLSPKGEQNYVTKDDLKDFGQRQRYTHLNDEEYTNINALAKASGKSFEETLEKNPIAAAYMKTIDVDKRLAGATKAPGTRFMPGEQKTEDDKVAEELSRDLPNGFKSQKS